MRYIAMILSVLLGSFSFALAQSQTGSGQSSANSSSAQGTAGTNLNANTTRMDRTKQPNSAQAERNAAQGIRSLPGQQGGSPTDRAGGSPGTDSRQQYPPADRARAPQVIRLPR